MYLVLQSIGDLSTLVVSTPVGGGS
jgi:hypothetical protein